MVAPRSDYDLGLVYQANVFNSLVTSQQDSTWGQVVRMTYIYAKEFLRSRFTASTAAEFTGQAIVGWKFARTEQRGRRVGE